MGEWFVTMENYDFILSVSKDRGEMKAIEISPKTRPRKGARMRTWSMSHLQGYLDGIEKHYSFVSFKEESEWLQNHEKDLLNTALLNSDELQKWAVKASRKLFGQD